MKKTKSTTRQYVSIRQLAVALGRSHTAVGRWLKDWRWKFSRRGPWPASMLPQIRVWMAKNLQEDRSTAEYFCVGSEEIAREFPELVEARGLRALSNYLDGKGPLPE